MASMVIIHPAMSNNFKNAGIAVISFDSFIVLFYLSKNKTINESSMH